MTSTWADRRQRSTPRSPCFSVPARRGFSSWSSTASHPALGVARLRASGDLAEVRAGSLRFDDAERVWFFAGAGVTGLSALEQRKLSERTGGCPVLLRLAALFDARSGPRAVHRVVHRCKPPGRGLPDEGRSAGSRTAGS